MRKILFRGKRDKKYDRNQEWVYGVPYIDCEGDWIMTDDCSKRVVVAETIGQYTGLTDKNGNKIFEGDVVFYARDDEVGQLAYHESEAMFIVEFDTWFTDFDHIFGDELEIIGNIHDNPELLEGGASDEKIC